MIRSDVLKTLIPLISDELVVTNIGLPSQEMHLLDDQPTNFYMLGTMGLASSIGLGLAMAQPKKVIAIDGDGSVLRALLAGGAAAGFGGRPRASLLCNRDSLMSNISFDALAFLRSFYFGN